MEKVKLKICGLTKEEEIDHINLVKPDYVGFVFAESKRRIDREQATRLGKLLSPEIIKVGIFVDDPTDEIVSLLNDGVIDAAQLHGNEDEGVIQYIREHTGKPVIRAVIIKNDTGNSVNTGYNNCLGINMETAADYLLLDSGKGSGKQFDWNMIGKIDKPFFLAGGINPDNVADAVTEIRPYCLDVSSGVERDGRKDPELIDRLVEAMRRAKL